MSIDLKNRLKSPLDLEKPIELIPQSFVEKMYIPTNENMRKNLIENVRSIHGKYVSDVVKAHFGTKVYVAPINGTGILLHECAAEDIPELIIDNPYEVGITGSDFLLEELYKRPDWGFIRAGNFIDPRYVYPEKVEKFRPYAFNRDGKLVPEEEVKGVYFGDKKIILKFLNQSTNPKLCILGAKDRTLEDIERQREKEGVPVLAVTEKRYKNIANATLTNQGINYTLATKTRKVESFINRPLDKPLPDRKYRDGKFDIGVEVGETFRTAGDNNLKLYREIMKTCPIYMVCLRR